MLTVSRGIFIVSQNGIAQSLHCFDSGSMVELLFFPSHLYVSSHCIKAKMVLSTFNIYIKK